MARTPPATWVRPRQRSRTSLPSFQRHLVPRLAEVGVDRFQLKISGHWAPGHLSAEDFLELLRHRPEPAPWFNAPDYFRGILRITSRSPSASTIGPIEIGWKPWGARVAVDLHCNPTRTLHHLLVGQPSSVDWLGHIGSLSPVSFFSPADAPRNSLDNQDNWLPDLDLSHARLGADIFGSFLPVYVHQLQLFVMQLLQPRATFALNEMGSRHVLFEQEAFVQIDWNDVQLPQIETYFERHHSTAQQAVQRVATNALTTLDQAFVTRHSEIVSDWVERTGDSLSVTMNLANERRLLVYAKDRSRLRFEIKRLTSSRIPRRQFPALLAPRDKLLAIINLERSYLLDVAAWPGIGTLFDERPVGTATDFAEFCAMLGEVCGGNRAILAAVLRQLLVDGGIASRGRGAVTPRIVSRLHKLGVLERRTVRGGNDVRRHGQRLSLTLPYRTMMEAVREALNDG